MRKKIPYIIFALVMIAIMLFPVKTAPELIRIDLLDNVNVKPADGDYRLYYSTIGPDAFSEEQRVESDVSAEKGYLEFRLDGELNNNIKGLRLDFPEGNGVYFIKDISVKSAGFVKKRINPCVFLDDPNIASRNDISDISTYTDGNVRCVFADGEDPHIVFSEDAVKTLTGNFSHFILTKLAVCLFLAGCFFSYVLNPFGLRKTAPVKEEKEA